MRPDTRSRFLILPPLAGLLFAACASTLPAPETRVFGASTVESPVGAVRAPESRRPAPSPAFREQEERGVPGAPVLGEARVDTALEAEIFVRANRARTSRGLPPLTLRPDLIAVARGHAVDMARRDYFSHYTPEGLGPGDRAHRAGVRFRAYAENLARVRHSSNPAPLAITSWLASPGHRRNLLDEGHAGYRFTGVGVAVAADGSVYLAQVFLE